MLFLMMTAFALNVSAQTIVGTWKSIDDETGKAKSIIKVYKAKNGKYYGKIMELLNRGANEEKDPYCKVCPGYRKDKRVITMKIITDMKASKDLKSADSGKILDPKSGKIYKCSMKLASGGDKLEVRGYIGFSLLGRTQTWIRMDK